MKSNLRSSIILNWDKTTIELLPSKSILVRETEELLISDIHLGKGEYFQAKGIPLTKPTTSGRVIRFDLPSTHNC